MIQIKIFSKEIRIMRSKIKLQMKFPVALCAEMTYEINERYLQFEWPSEQKQMSHLAIKFRL